MEALGMKALRTIDLVASLTERQRLARAFAEFWRGGSGPSHGDLNRVFDGCDLDVETLGGSKSDRVHAAIVQIPDTDLDVLLHGWSICSSRGECLTRTISGQQTRP